MFYYPAVNVNFNRLKEMSKSFFINRPAQGYKL